jgi:hypothetical protein
MLPTRHLRPPGLHPLLGHVPQGILGGEAEDCRGHNYFLHNQRGALLAARLMARGVDHIVIVRVPWYLKQ